MYKPKAASIYINRNCPRRCPYCNVVDLEKEKLRLSLEDWKEAFRILKYNVGIEFFLILGTEPLLMENDLTELVKFWKEEDIEYGLYSTAPRYLFQRSAPRLIHAGLRNWSSGIDFIPEVYENGDWSETTHQLVESQGGELIKKADDSLYGLKYMEGRIPELHAMPTISRMNIEMMPNIIRWLVDNFDNSMHMALNFVEYSQEENMDFATKDEVSDNFFFHKGDEPILKKLSEEMHSLPEKYQSRVQTSIDYVDDYEHILNLDWKCTLNSMAMSVDCDGTIRQCGYKDSPKNGRYNVFEIPEKKTEILKYLEDLHNKCSGCYWSYPWALEKSTIDIVNYRSKLWQKRDKEE